MGGNGQLLNPILTAGRIAALLAASSVGLSMADDKFTLYDPAAPTKIIRFDAGLVTAGQTRVAQFPDADITVPGINLAQTWSATQTFAAITATGITVTPTSGAALTLGSASGASSGIASGLGNIIRHEQYGYSTAYTAVYIGSSARGVGFGVNPNTITGGQFTGDAHDAFFQRGVNFIVPNSGATDWECALRISSGFGVANNPIVEISTAGLTLSNAAGGVISVGATTDSSSTTTGSIVTAGGMAWGATKTTYGGNLNLAGTLTATGAIYSSRSIETNGALVSVGASKLTLDQSDVSTSRIIAFGVDDSTGGTLQFVSASSAVGVYVNAFSVSAASGAIFSLAADFSSGITISGGSFRINQTPVAETPSATHTAVMNFNGTNYRVLCLI
jgi:hypothetical protein